MTSEQPVQKVIIREYRSQEEIIGEGTSQDRFYVVLQGNIEIYQRKKSIRILHEGDVFGLENHYLNHPYSTSAIAVTKSRIASYHTSMIGEIIFERPQLVEQILISVMRQLEQTTQIAQEHIPSQIPLDVNERVYEDGEDIITEGSDGTAFYHLIRTQHGLRVHVGGREVGTITRSGEYFGEISAVLHTKRTATVTSIGQSTVRIIDTENLEQILAADAELSISLINALAVRLRERNLSLP